MRTEAVVALLVVLASVGAAAPAAPVPGGTAWGAVADAAVAFAAGVDADDSPSEILARFDPLASTYAGFASAASPEAAAGMAWNLEALARARTIAVAVDAAGEMIDVGEAVSIGLATGRLVPEHAERARHAIDLQRAVEAGAAPDVALAAALAPRATPSLPEVARHATLSAAVLAVFDLQGVQPTDPAAIERLDSLSPQRAGAIQRIVEAHVFQAIVTDAAIAPALHELAAGRSFEEAAVRVDVATLAAIQPVVAADVVHALRELARAPAAADEPTVSQCGILNIRLAAEPTTYVAGCDFSLSIDVGGDDTYHNNAGGGRFGAALLVDVAGDDRYIGAPLVEGAWSGGALFGSGFLFEGAGDDAYDAASADSGAVTGGAAGGAGFLYDASGNDTYDGTIGNEGGVNGASFLGSGFLFDADGRDDYDGEVRTGGVNGGSSGGDGFLFDGAGDDAFNGTVRAAGGGSGGVNGASVAGSGTLVDVSGDDTYEGRLLLASGAINGAGTGLLSGAYGLLLDGGGNDTYAGSLPHGAVNGGGNALGAETGAGALLDLGGDDTYVGAARLSGGINGGAFGKATGFLFDGGGDDTFDGNVDLNGPKPGGINGGGSSLGSGALVDADGRDRYTGSVSQGGVNGGGDPVSEGVLVDGGGDDTYVGTVLVGGVNGGAYSGSGLLIDRSGDDVYGGDASYGGMNGGSNGDSTTLPNGGIGMLIDGGGNDDYDGEVEGGINGASHLAFGLLADGGGKNRFSGRSSGYGGGSNGAAGVWDPRITTVNQRFVPGGVGVLLAGAGDDSYFGNGTTQGAAVLSGVGILVDAGGTNAYDAGPGDVLPYAPGLAQGAGKDGGLGILLDAGASSNFRIRAGTTGQGSGVLGAGLLLRPSTEGESVYVRDEGSLTAQLSGAGSGIHRDQGIATFFPPVDAILCPSSSPEIFHERISSHEPVPTATPERVFDVRLCDGDREDGQPLRDVEGEPVGDVEKPTCAELVVCEAIVATGLLTPAQVEWLRADHVTTTTSGGLAELTYTDATTLARFEYATSVRPSADKVCGRTGCLAG